jgi:DNA polymerase-3 subunit delta'
MNLYAANAFLKTLEEPPENSLLILVSSNPDRLPDTIRSRCSRITFTPLSQGACREVIDKVFSQRLTVSGKKSGRQVNSEADIPHGHTAIDSRLSTLVRLSMGRPGEAVAADLIEERTWFLKLLKGMLNVERDGWGSKEDMERWYDLVLILLRDMAVMKITGDEADLINSDLKEYISRLCNSMDIKGIIEQYQRLNAMKGYFPFHLNKSLTWNYTGSLLRKDMDTTHA